MIAEEAYAEVERLTRRRARNFAYGIMLLPREKRRAIAAIYAFARRVDDIADGSLPDDAKRVVWTPGVRRLVTFEGAAPPLPPDAVEFLRTRGGPDGVIVARPRPLPPGQRVRVTDGPLAGLVGIIENPPDPRGRVSVLMDILRTQTRVSLDVGALEDA